MANSENALLACKQGNIKLSLCWSTNRRDKGGCCSLRFFAAAQPLLLCSSIARMRKEEFFNKKKDFSRECQIRIIYESETGK